MSRHATAEDLSAYLDQELEAPQLRLVKDHLETCEPCRRKLQGLRGVQHQLHRLEQLAPPPLLAGDIQRRVRLEPRHRGLFDNLEDRLRRLPEQGTMLVVFASVFALAVIGYLFTEGIQRHEGRTSVIVPSAGTVTEADAEHPTVEVEGRRFEQVDGGWRELDLPADAERLTLRVGTPDGDAVLARHPKLQSLLGGSTQVVLRDTVDGRERVVVLVP